MDLQEIRRWHSVFKRNGELFEIRIIGDRTWSGYFYDVEEAIKQLAPFDNANIYYTINEVKSACASRDQFNCFKQVKGTATSKQDIEHRWWLPIDVDCERPSGVSSTDDEKSKAHKKAQDVFVFLRDNGFSTPVVCDSSSGYHILYPIDMDNTQEQLMSLFQTLPLADSWLYNPNKQHKNWKPDFDWWMANTNGWLTKALEGEGAYRESTSIRKYYAW